MSFSNRAILNGLYGEIPIPDPGIESEVVVVSTFDDISIVKSSDTLVWATTDPVTFTVAITNNALAGGAILSGLSIEDTLDTSIEYVVDSAEIDDTPIPTENVSFVGNVLTLTLTGVEIAPTESINVTFQVQQAAS